MKIRLIANPPAIVTERGQMLTLGLVATAEAFGWTQMEPNQSEDARRFIEHHDGKECDADGLAIPR